MSTFPHAGYPIAPPTLRPVLSVGLPAFFARLADDFPLLADLDERIWGYVDLSIAERLGALVISRAEQMRDAPFWKITHFPRVKSAVQLEALAIEEATAGCLRSRCGSSFVWDAPSFADYTLDHLASLFGLRPTIDLLAALRFHTLGASDVDGATRLTRSDLQNLTRHPRTWPSYSHKFFPVLSKAWTLTDLSISVRTYNCLNALIRRGVINDVADLSRLTIRHVMQLYAFGVVSLVDLLKAIEPMILDALLTQASPNLSAAEAPIRRPTKQVPSEGASRLHSPQSSSLPPIGIFPRFLRPPRLRI